MEALSLTEQTELQEMEGIIETGLRTFYEVGRAMATIRDSRLYREAYDTFEEYCKDRWDMGINYADRLLRSTKVIENIKSVPMGTKPANERQTRPLTKLGTKQLQQEAWEKVVETAPEGKVTARHVSKVVSEMLDANTIKEVGKKGKKMRQIIDETERMDEDFKRAFDAFYGEVQTARLDDWETTSREAALECVEITKDLIEVM